jgi:putative ABC transport system ATP-binding protein
MMDFIIKTDNVTKVYNPGLPDEIKAVNDISIEIKRGEVVVLKGPSGSGKTSLLSLLGCMARPTEGRISVNGKDVAKLPERFLTGIRQRTFGFIFQQLNLIKDISVIENVMLPLYPTDTKFAAIRKRAESILEKLDILKKRNFKVKMLSGGEQQRTAIARALINEPEIILADEPTAHLDTKLSEDLIDILSALQKDGKTIVIATHDPRVYEREFVNRLIKMRDGTIKDVMVKEAITG